MKFIVFLIVKNNLVCSPKTWKPGKSNRSVHHLPLPPTSEEWNLSRTVSASVGQGPFLVLVGNRWLPQDLGFILGRLPADWPSLPDGSQ